MTDLARGKPIEPESDEWEFDDGASSGRRYDSTGMRQRRARILKEAQLLLGEEGIEGFTITKLSRRADVAQRTLYNSLGSREEIIGRAISEHYASLTRLLPPFAGRTIDEYVNRASLISGFVVQLRSYASAMVSVFFSPNVDPRIYDRLNQIPEQAYGEVLALMEAAGIARPPSDRERVLAARRMSHLSYALVSDWAAGRLSDDEFRARSPLCPLWAYYPLMLPEARAHADALFERFTREGLVCPAGDLPTLPDGA